MTAQLLPLRLLTSFKLFSHSRFALKTLTFASSSSSLRFSTVRCLSSLPARSRDSRDDGRSSFRSARAAAGGKGKSLIDDEAELSDWVSDLDTSSIRLGLSGSDDDDSSSRVRVRDRDRDSSGFLDRRIMRGNLSNRGSKAGSNGLRGGRDSGGFSERRDSGGFSERRNLRGSLSNRGSRGGPSGLRNGRGSDKKVRFGSDFEDEDEDEGKKELLYRQRGGSFGGKGGKGGVQSSYKQGRKAPFHEISEEDDDTDEEGGEVSGFDDDLFGDDEVDGKKLGTKDSVLKSVVKSVSRSSGEGGDSYLSNTRFDQCSLSSLTLKGVKAAGYERMTLVQEATLPVILKGKDVLAKARTGTGKTVAFLLPAIEIVSKLPSVDRDQKRPPINVLIMCPTRELADQAATEAGALLKFHPSIGVQVVIGGTRLALEQKRMQANPCQILVATPGRLRDHIENTPGFATRLMGVKVLVLDEADRLLDMGFRKDIEKIVAAVPKQRQTLLFSATVPDQVRQICYIAMKRDHEFVNTVEEGSEETHAQVRQMHLVAPLEKQFPILYGILKDHIAEDVDYKVIVFCTTAMVTRLVADLLSELRLNVREIHSRKPQSYRTRVSKEFKESKGLILVSSDVSARGVDYPDVTLVVQIGVPADREQYIHRLGRTGRKGKEGEGILLLAPWEEFFLSSVKDLPITQAPMPLIDPDIRKKVERSLDHVEMKNKEAAYQAWLGYYNSNKNIGRDKCKLVLLANEFSRSMGLDNPPAIAKLVLRKMGLSNVPGLRTK